MKDSNSDNKLNKVCEKNDSKISDSVEKRFQSLLNDGSNAPVHTNSSDFDLPSFYDPEKFHLGQRAFCNNIFAMLIAKLAGLISLLTIPSVLDVIKFTKQTSTPCLAFRRYISTLLHMFVWYEKEPFKQIEFLKSLKIVRKKHCIVFRRSDKAGISKVSQADMAYAQFGFMGYILLCNEQLGIYTTDEEMEGFVHFWRVIGCTLGMEDKYNVCMETVEETRALCSKILDKVFLTSVINYKKNFDEMGQMLIKGFWPFLPALDPAAFSALTLHLASLADINNNRNIEIDYDSMSFYSKSLFNIELFVLRYLMPTKYWWSVIFRTLFNYLMILAIYLIQHFPLLAYWSFGIKQAKIDIFRYDISK